MSQKKYFSYIRVSTQRQGQHGTSLAEQQAAIERFAEGWKLPIIKRFEERETAAKQGRPVFLDMLKQLKSGKADGVIIHKIDRSARNLKDWADLGNLIDGGLEVHFASESLDLNSRGGRLSADIQAVVAADYIRNLSEEAKKGLYGRLKQGLYPFRAMIGYLDRGSGKPKEIDPVSGPLIKRAFQLYGTGEWSLVELTQEMNRCGLKTKTGKPLTKTGLAWILHNTFYMGLITIKKNGQQFAGLHQPIVSRRLYHQVQDVFSGKNAKKVFRHFFVFRKLIACHICGRPLTPEVQKGITYYRCRTKHCLRHCLRETAVAAEFLRLLKKLRFNDFEYEAIRREAAAEIGFVEERARATQEHLRLQQAQLEDLNSRLVDAFMNGTFDEATYVRKKNEYLQEGLELKENMLYAETNGGNLLSALDEFCELSNSAYLSYKSGRPEDRRNLVKTVAANLTTDRESVLIKLKMPFQIVAERRVVQYGWASPDTRRTITQLSKQIVKVLQANPALLQPEIVA